jgi:ABC-2 type transport system ATP-binding protein
MKIIETKGLTKVYSSSFKKNKVQALVDFNLNVEKGVIFGLLGPNGAGKTTLVKLLLGITFPTAGSASMIERDIYDYKTKKEIGYLPENHKYPSYLKGGEVLKYFGRLSGMNGAGLDKRIDELLELVKLSQWKKTKVKAYSKGMMQRLGLAQALINDPELIFLDEPTDGVDPIGRKEIRDILAELKNRQKTIFLNSHLLSEVELITDRVGILNKGKLLREGTVKELTEKKEEYKLVVDSTSENIGIDNAAFTKQPDGSYLVKVTDINELNKIIDNIRSKGILLKEIVPLKNTLEEMFISLINESEKSGK